MSEEYNWKLYRSELETCFANNIPCIPFLGVLLTTIVQQESITLSRNGQMSRHGRKRISGVEMYTILEAITVRNRSVHNFLSAHIHKNGQKINSNNNVLII